MALAEAEQAGSFVLHVDADAFFVQIEQQRHPELQGLPVAIQQHQDIIAANAAAKAAGVVKHMAPAAARRLLGPLGGRVANVHCEAGGRVSYRPYREASTRLIRLLKGLPWACVVEKASIDEAFVLLRPGPDAAAGVCPAAALRHAHEAKAAAAAQLGLTVSVGAAPNRLLAKLASAAAKPDGVRLVPDSPAALQLLAQTPARKLPGYGGRAAEAFERYGVRAATDLQRFSQLQLEQLFGLKPANAAQLVQWCRGMDDTPVQERGPPKSLSIQMSLTPQLLHMPTHGGPPTVPVAGGRAGVLEPLVVGKPDFRPRVRQLATAMGLDLLARVQEDAAEEARWPKTLTGSLRAFGAGRDQAFTSRSGGFPSSGLARQPLRPDAAQQAAQQAQQQAQQQVAPQQRPAAGEQPADALEEAVVHGLEQLLHLAAAAYPPTAKVVELRLAATNFQSAAAAAAAAPITRFFAAAVKKKGEEEEEEEEEQQQQQQQPPEQQREQREQQREQPQPQRQQLQQQQSEQQREQREQQREQPQLQRQQPQQRPQGAAATLPSSSQRPLSPQPEEQPHAGSTDVDLGSIDVREQERILAQLQQQQQQRPAGKPSGGGTKRKATVAPAPGQKLISSFLK